MSGPEWIGFFISLISLVFLFFNQRHLAENRGLKQDQIEGEQDDSQDSSSEPPLTQLIRSIEQEGRESKIARAKPVMPPKAPGAPSTRIDLEGYKLESRLGKHHLTKREDHLHVSVGDRGVLTRTPRIRHVLSKLPNLQTAFICHEIFKKPPGFM